MIIFRLHYGPTSTIHIMSVIVATEMMSTDIKISADKDSIALQIIKVFNLQLFLHTSMLLISFRPVKHSSLHYGAEHIASYSSTEALS